MPAACQHCGAPLAVGAVACFRCGRMVARAEEPGTGASVVIAPTHMGTVAKAELLEGQWRLVKLLGQGTVGQVWQAHDVTLDRAVAVKLMHQALSADPAQVTRFEREARVLAGLEHPNLLPVLGIGRSAGRPFLVTRLLEGRTLAELIHQRGGKLPLGEAARVLAPICDALACLHAATVVHRDLKPSNVFVGDDKRVTLMDLGSAHEAGSELTHFGDVLGTVGYLSPEQKLGKRGLDGKSDVYALGCLLVEVLTGKLSTEAGATQNLPPLPVITLARAMLSNEPADRPTALEVRAKLAPYLVSEEPTSPMARQLEAPTQHAVFTPTTGSPSYPDLRAIKVPEAERREDEPANRARRAEPPARTEAERREDEPANRARRAEPPAKTEAETKDAPSSQYVDRPTANVGSTVVVSMSSIVAPAVRSSGAISNAGFVPEGATRRVAPLSRPKPRLSKSAALAMGILAVGILGAFALGLAEPPARVPEPVRVDQPSVIAPIQKDEFKVVRFSEEPKPAPTFVPNLNERKSELNATYGYEKRVVRKPNRGAVKLGTIRITTTVSGFVVPAVLWIKSRKSQKVWDLVGQTPVELAVEPGELQLQLQYEDDPFIHVPYLVLPRKDWPKEIGGMRLEIPVRNDALSEETVSQGEQHAQRVSGADSSVKPMTRQRPRGGK